MKRLRAGLLLLLVFLLIIIGSWRCASVRYTMTRLPEAVALAETDDRLEDKNPAFDENRVDSRLLKDWEVNQSGAVIGLYCPEIDPRHEAELLGLRPNYEGNAASRDAVLPSANLLDGAAKQFDDGLYAALDLACYNGELGDSMPGAVRLISGIFDRLPENSPAKPFLGAALQLAGKSVNLTGQAAKEQKRLIKAFEAATVSSKPTSFYTWKPELEQVWKFYRFLQREFAEEKDLDVPKALAEVLAANGGLLKEYQALQEFYGHLTNPLVCLPVTALTEGPDSVDVLAKKYHAHHAAVAVFPPSTSRESELFERVFPEGIPNNAEVMTELIRRIRLGDTDLQPTPEDGWYQYQVHALECLLLPAKNQESERLVLAASYKKRLVEAFKVMFAKRRETHARQFGPALSAVSVPNPRLTHVAPRLRVEPCPTVYLRNARAYAFLQNFLRSMVPADRLKALHGLREGGSREMNLDDELESVRLRTYGFYLVSCEDIGMAPKFMEGEPVDQEAAKKAALDWLSQMDKNADLACDTRVAVPVYYNPMTNKVRLWVTLGVRMAKLNANYLRPPKIRPHKEGGPWQEVKDTELATAEMLIPVDEFAEVEINADKIPNRAELRALCDKYTTKEEIIGALQRL